MTKEKKKPLDEMMPRRFDCWLLLELVVFTLIFSVVFLVMFIMADFW